MPSTSPETVTADVINSTSIKLNWIAVPMIDQNGIVIQYEVMYTPLLTFGVITTMTVFTTNLSITLLALEEYVEYNISVRAYTSVGPGPYSVGIAIRTFEAGKLGCPYSLDWTTGLTFKFELSYAVLESLRAGQT